MEGRANLCGKVRAIKVETLTGWSAPPPPVSKAGEGGGPGPASRGRSSRNRYATCTCDCAITTLPPHDASGDNSDRVSPFYRCSQHRRTRSERKVVTDRTLKAWYHPSIA